jgi:hypothetical protein
MGIAVGFAAPNQNAVVGFFAQNNGARHRYAYNGESLIGLAAATCSARALMTGVAASQVTFNWLDREYTGNAYTMLVLGGDFSAAVLSGATRTDGADIALTGAGFTPLGGLVAGAFGPASTQDVPDSTGVGMSVGAVLSATDRSAIGVSCDGDDAAYGQELDEAYLKLTVAGVVDALMDSVSLDSDGATFVMDDTEPTAGSFFCTLLLGAAASGIPAGVLAAILGDEGD